jgi:hypothetical protein
MLSTVLFQVILSVAMATITHYHKDSLLWTVIPKLYPQVPPETLNEAVLREGRVFWEI